MNNFTYLTNNTRKLYIIPSGTIISPVEVGVNMGEFMLTRYNDIYHALLYIPQYSEIRLVQTIVDWRITSYQTIDDLVSTWFDRRLIKRELKGVEISGFIMLKQSLF